MDASSCILVEDAKAVSQDGTDHVISSQSPTEGMYFYELRIFDSRGYSYENDSCGTKNVVLQKLLKTED